MLSSIPNWIDDWKWFWKVKTEYIFKNWVGIIENTGFIQFLNLYILQKL